jgi:hypothetical protein
MSWFLILALWRNKFAFLCGPKEGNELKRGGGFINETIP